ncbi:MAG: alanine--tRNA ligase [Alphaproteobacteria bacterium]|nr:alanine--tRNA ligase [Alphaproteobacteria bacterium]MBV9152662.1 alanine--tRNA ligase [Alphaproteobacteria bacterium]
MQTTNDIRAAFLDYFARHDHAVVPSSPLVPRNDPTLLFTNAGMVQFKNVFTGVERRSYQRAATSQKCVRAGGKHNDLENVGYTARHHTFFEMLGNFSFGDYFKDRAIELAWNLVVKEFGLPEDRLLVTVYAEDEDAARLWAQIAGLPERKIIRIATADNFWAMGDTGPCGPCSEIFYDHGEGIPGGPPGSPDQDGDRFVEIWNLVFMQFEQLPGGERVPLPRPSIDTGMGLERIAAVLQGKHDNYDIDLFRALIMASAEASGVAPDGAHAVSHRVIADHLRASSFLIADGVLPSKEGRGYVLRRIMRRAMRHAHMLGCKEPLMWRLVPALVQQMGAAFPELLRAQPLIAETLRFEEANFKQTLDRGLRLLEEQSGDYGQTSGPGLLPDGKTLAGNVAFVLYDTYGFPFDLTEDILRGHGMRVDTAGFDREMGEARQRSRASWVGSGEAATEAAWFALREEVGPTEFLGYDTETAEGVILALVKGEESVGEAQNGDEVGIIVNQTPFYGESGGQVGDTGAIFSATSGEFAVADTLRKAGDLFVHLGRVTHGTLRVADAVEMRVDTERRRRLRANHSVTHLLHQALRHRLGEHVTQKGSLVAPDRLRFDFSHPRPLNAEDIAAVEAEVNAQIRANADVRTRLLSPERAVAEGALALFGEKYGEEVRVVAMGSAADRNDEILPYSVELCGGTHVRRTGDIGLFKIVGESSVASGVRRIEALTGAAAEAYIAQEESALRESAAALRTSPAELPARLARLIEDNRRLERELAEARRTLAVGGQAGGLPRDQPRTATNGKRIGSIVFDGRVVDNVPGRDLRSLADDLKRRIGSGIVTVVSRADGKAAIVVGVTPDLTNRFDAVELARVGAAALGGKGGGGRPDMAQAGGPAGEQAEAALAAVERLLSERIEDQVAHEIH